MTLKANLARMTRRAVAMAVTGALALTLLAATGVAADDSDYDDGWLTLDTEVTVELDGDFLGIRWLF